MKKSEPAFDFQEVTMEQNSFPNIWFADEKRSRGIAKMLAYKDKGSLKIEEDYLEFGGQKLRFRISNINRISIVRQQLPWPSYLLVNILLIIYLLIFRGIFATQIPPVYWILLLLVSNVFGIAVGYSTKWIKIEYTDEQNMPRSAYFADGSSRGWGGIFGGTEKLYREIKPEIMND